MAESKHTPLPWEKRGWCMYVPGTQKKILECSLAWRSSAETQANIDLVASALSERDSLREENERLRADVEQVRSQIESRARLAREAKLPELAGTLDRYEAQLRNALRTANGESK